MGRLLAFAVAAAAGGALLPAAPAAAAVDCYADAAPVCVRAAVLGQSAVAGSYKPKRISTIEYTVPVVQITWSSWTRQKAVGRGRISRCGGCDPADPGPRVTITLSRPKQYFCGSDESQLEPIGIWFSRATIQGPGFSIARNIIEQGHPNAC
jgi:hypothetical protein